jgi:hypothetical protein
MLPKLQKGDIVSLWPSEVGRNNSDPPTSYPLGTWQTVSISSRLFQRNQKSFYKSTDLKDWFELGASGSHL